MTSTIPTISTAGGAKTITRRLTMIVCIAASTYALVTMRQLDELLYALAQRPPRIPAAAQLAVYGTWILVAAAVVAAFILLFRPTAQRVVAAGWLVVVSLCVVCTWIAFGPDWWTTLALFVAIAVTLWVRSIPRAA